MPFNSNKRFGYEFDLLRSKGNVRAKLSYPSGFNGQEKDDEIKGSGNHLSFGDYGYDPRIGRRWNIEPMIGKYPSYSSYFVFGNNPIINFDPDGKDKVYFNADGTEAYREKSTTEFKSYIIANKNAGNPQISVVGWKEVAMPKIIEERTQSAESTTGTQYQENDYVIAARVGYFNQAINTDQLHLYTEGGHVIPQDAVKAIPDLDPTLIKAIAIQESHAGVTGETDIMTANNPNDWKATSTLKSAYGLTRDTKLSKTNSLYYGIRMLASKGFKFGIDGKGVYNFKGWEHATKYYNYPGVKGYENYVKTMQDNATTPDCSDYTDECK
jgi:hypothetical protein